MIGELFSPLHCESVKIDIDFIILFHLQVPHLSIEKLALCGRVSSSAGFQSSPQNILTNFWRGLRADVREWLEVPRHPLLDHLRRCLNRCRNQWLFRKGLALLDHRRTAGLLKSSRDIGWSNQTRRGNENTIICSLSFTLVTEARHVHSRTRGLRLPGHGHESGTLGR